MKEQENKLTGNDNVSQSATRRRIKQCAHLFNTTEPVGKALAELDGTGATGAVLSGVYCVVRAIGGVTDEDLKVLRLTLENSAAARTLAAV